MYTSKEYTGESIARALLQFFSKYGYGIFEERISDPGSDIMSSTVSCLNKCSIFSGQTWVQRCRTDQQFSRNREKQEMYGDFDRLNFVREEEFRIHTMECNLNKICYTLISNFTSFMVNNEIENKL